MFSDTPLIRFRNIKTNINPPKELCPICDKKFLLISSSAQATKLQTQITKSRIVFHELNPDIICI